MHLGDLHPKQHKQSSNRKVWCHCVAVFEKYQFVGRQLPQLFKLAVEVALVQYRVPLRLRGICSYHEHTNEDIRRTAWPSILGSGRSTHVTKHCPCARTTERLPEGRSPKQHVSPTAAVWPEQRRQRLRVTHQQKSGRKSCEGGEQHGLPANAPPIAQDIPQARHAYRSAQAGGVRAASGTARLLSPCCVRSNPIARLCITSPEPPEALSAREDSVTVPGAPATTKDNRLRHRPLSIGDNVEAVLACTLLCPRRLSGPAWPSNVLS